MLSFARGMSAAREYPSERAGKPLGSTATHSPAAQPHARQIPQLPPTQTAPNSLPVPELLFLCEGRSQVSDGAQAEPSTG